MANETIRVLADARRTSQQQAREQREYAEELRLAGGKLVHGASKLSAPSPGNEMLTTPCGGEWPLVLRESASRPSESNVAGDVTCFRCRAALGLDVRSVTFTAALPVGNPDMGAEVDVEVTALVDMDGDKSIDDSILFVQPTLSDLQDVYGDRCINVLMEDCVVVLSQQLRREKEAAEEAAALVAVLS